MTIKVGELKEVLNKVMKLKKVLKKVNSLKKSTQKSNEQKKELKKVKSNGQLTQKRTQTSSPTRTQKVLKKEIYS